MNLFWILVIMIVGLGILAAIGVWAGIWLAKQLSAPIHVSRFTFQQKWFERFRIKPVRRAEALGGEERKRLFQSVGENDPCLRATIDVLEEKLYGNILTAMDRRAPDQLRIASANSAADAYFTLETIEKERTKPKPEERR